MEDRQVPHDDPARTTLVINTELEAAPGHALLEVVDYDPERSAFLVRKPTRHGANDLLVNGPVAIEPNTEGTAIIGPWAAVRWASDGSMPITVDNEETAPEVGTTVGSVAGQWYASQRYAGFVVAATFGLAGEKLAICRPMSYNLVEFIEITDCQSDENIPANYSPAKVVYFDPAQNLFVDPPTLQEVWYRDKSGDGKSTVSEGSSEPCRVQAIRAGIGEGRPVYVGDASDCVVCPDFTTTTTTASPCGGTCRWAWNFLTQAWEVADSDCDEGCACFAPTWCPPSNYGGAVCTYTACGRFSEDQAPPNCTGTTTTPSGDCTTTIGPGCTEGCTWKCSPNLQSWIRLTNGCNPTCPCSPPATACETPCDDAFTPCNVIPPPVCGGSCSWVWVTPDNVW
jgi:hypothetical protein